MSLRNHLHQWLHPRDPLLEAWREDPFVELMAERFSRGSVLSRNGFLNGLKALACLCVLMGMSYLLVRSVPIPAEAVFIMAFFIFIHWAERGHAFGLIRFQTPSLIKADNEFDDLSPNGPLASLWLTGVRGRDIAMALYASRGPGINYGALVMIIIPLFFAGLFLLFHLLDGRGIRFVEFVCITLFLSWPICICWRLMVSRGNPFQSMQNLPLFLEPLEKSLHGRRQKQADPIPRSALVIVGFVLVSMFISWPVRGLPFLPYGLLMFASGIALANYMILSAPRETAQSVKEKLEKRFPIVDREFDKYVRMIVMEDPDAER